MQSAILLALIVTPRIVPPGPKTPPPPAVESPAAELPPPFYPVLPRRRSRPVTGSIEIPTDLRDALGAAPARKPLGRPAAANPAGWRSTASSLLLFDAEGELINEIGLGDWTDELGDKKIRRRTMRGGVSKNGRFAWHWQKVETLRRGRDDEVLSSTHSLVYLGTAGQILWRSSLIDAPAGVSPLAQSADGETAFVLERSTRGYSAAAVTFTGIRFLELPPAQRVEKLSLTKNGRFAHTLWSQIDRPLIHTFLDIKKKSRKDIPAAETVLGEASIGEDGTIRSGSKILYRFP